MSGIYFAGNFLSKKLGTRSVNEELALKLKNLGYETFTASNYQNRIFRMVDLLWTGWRWRKEYRVAIIEVYSGLAFSWAELLCAFLKRMNKLYILSLHGGKLAEFERIHPLRVKNLLASATRVTTPSRYLQKAFATVRPDIQYLPNGIELADYPYSNRTLAQPDLIWLRAFHQIYQPTLAVKVLDQLVKEIPDVRLTMIGPDKKDGTLGETRQLIQEKNLQEKIKIIGGIPKIEVGSQLSRGDIFLNTTLYESFGVSVAEAAACGLCIVTTNVGELPYLWEDGVDALLVPPNDPEAMAAAVRRILTEPELAAKLSANARKKAEQFDWSVILPQWEKLIEEVIEN